MSALTLPMARVPLPCTTTAFFPTCSVKGRALSPTASWSRLTVSRRKKCWPSTMKPICHRRCRMHWTKRATRAQRRPLTTTRAHPATATEWRTALLAALLAFAGNAAAFDFSDLDIAPGFTLELYADDVENARQMAYAEDGTLFVGSRHAGNLYALPDRNRDYRADEVITLASDFKRPSGIAYRDGDLYVADINRVFRYPDILKNLRADAPRE